MKLKFLIPSVLLVTLFSCNNKNKSEEIASYAYSSELKLSKVLQERVGSWIEEGKECYGILVLSDKKGQILNAKVIPAKALVITEKAIKMKALESISVAPKEGCTKMGLEKGDTWWENDGDLFQTKEEALAYIKTLTTKRSIEKENSYFTID